MRFMVDLGRKWSSQANFPIQIYNKKQMMILFFLFYNLFKDNLLVVAQGRGVTNA